MPQTKERIFDALRVLLAAGGPFSAVVFRYTEMSESDYNLLLQLALFVIPPAGAWAWGLYLNSMQRKVQAIAEAPGHVQQQALNKVSDGAKVLIAEAVPGVETVVVKNNVNGELGAIAASSAHPNVVTAQQNEKDAKEGYSLKEQT